MNADLIIAKVIRCECGYIYKILTTIKRGMVNIIVVCPLCRLKYVVPKNMWEKTQSRGIS